MQIKAPNPELQFAVDGSDDLKCGASAVSTYMSMRSDRSTSVQIQAEAEGSSYGKGSGVPGKA